MCIASSSISFSKSLYRSENEILNFEMSLGLAPENISGHDLYIAYIWSLGIDQNPDTGYRHGKLGAEFHVRLAKNGDDDWRIYVDDMTPDDAYEFRNATPWFTMKNTLIRLQVPAEGFSLIENFDWGSGTLAISKKEPKSVVCYDRSWPDDVFHGY